MATSFATVDEYVRSYPDDVQEILEQIRVTIRSVVPDYGETISYGMPCVTMNGEHLMYFAAWKHHIGMYPIPGADGPLQKELAPYRSAKDTVKFLYKKSIPYDLIGRIAELVMQRR